MKYFIVSFLLVASAGAEVVKDTSLKTMDRSSEVKTRQKNIQKQEERSAEPIKNTYDIGPYKDGKMIFHTGGTKAEQQD